MARPRHLNPSPIALRRRAERSSAPAAPVPSTVTPHDDAPEIDSNSPTEEAVRLRAVYDARKSRLSSLAEGLRLEMERGKLWTSAQVRARDEKWNGSLEDRLDLVERLLDQIDGITPDQRKSFLTASRAWRLETKRILASVHA
jgi:hypothetical protein